MSVEFPEDLLPLSGSITGTERMLADKNTVTVEQLAGFVQSSIGVVVDPLNFTPMQEGNHFDNIVWCGGYRTRIGPVVMLQGSFDFEVVNTDSDAVLYYPLSYLGIPEPRIEGGVGLGVRGFATRALDWQKNHFPTEVAVGRMGPQNPAIIAFNIDVSTLVPLDNITFFISYLTND